MMNSIFNFLKGIFIGSGAILPGISSGVLCVIFGIYEDLLDRILNFFRNPKENLKFLFPLVLGGFLGIFLIGKVLLFLLEHFNMPTCFCFIGLILGCIPSILKQTEVKRNRFLHYLCLLGTLSFSLYLVVLEAFGDITTTKDAISSVNLGMGGFLMSAGIVIPGVSSSAILMIMGMYETYLNSIASLNLQYLIPLGFGIVVGGFLFLKLIQFLFQHFRSYTYYAIVGFTIGSVFILYPGFEWNFMGIISLVLLAASFLLSRQLDKIKS